MNKTMRSTDDLSQRERDILTFIQSQIETRGFPPSVREIAGAVQLNSTAAALNNLRRMEEKGILKRDPSKPRAIELLGASTSEPGSVKMVLKGKIEGGVLRNFSNGEGIISFMFPKSFANGGEGSLYRMADDLSITKDLSAGDLAIIDFKGRDFKTNDLAIVKMEEELRLGRLTQVNPSPRIMRCREGARCMKVVKREDICGKITAVIRRFN